MEAENALRKNRGWLSLFKRERASYMPLGMKSTATPIVAIIATNTTARNATVGLIPAVELVERMVSASNPTIAHRIRATEIFTTLLPIEAIVLGLRETIDVF
jgi:hypothetical protein